MSSAPSNDVPRPPSASRSRDDAWAATELIPRSSRESRHGNALPVGTHLGEFELLRVLGEGGFGIVYLAQDHSLQRQVAIKEYMPASLATRAGALEVVVTGDRQRPVFDAGLDSFVNEARLLAQFDHPSLLKVYRFWRANGTAYMVMPFYAGVTLKERLKQLGAPPDERWLMALLAALTDALALIHAEHCLHRDIAPDNILMLSDSGRPLLLDFGAARQVIGDATQALTAILKPGYAPVEQYADVPGLKQGPWTDVYALCAVIHVAIMGSKPPVSVARSVVDGYVPLVRSAAGRYSARFLQAIDDGLQVRPAERTASVGALRQALGIAPGGPAHAAPRQAVADAAAPKAGPPSAAPSVSGSTTPSRTGLIVGGVAALAVAGGLAFWAGQRQSTPPPPAVNMPAAAPLAEAPAAPAGNSTAPAAIAAGPTAAPGTVSAEFDRLIQARQPDFSVMARPAQPRLRIGRDRLAFTVDSNRDGHVYVLVGGADGSLMLLFPNSMASDNRIRAGERLRLPQANWPLETSEPSGTEHFVVIVSEHPRDFSRISSGREDWFLKLPSGAAAAAAAQAHAGPGSVMAGQARCAAAGCDVYGAARFSVEIVR